MRRLTRTVATSIVLAGCVAALVVELAPGEIEPQRAGVLCTAPAFAWFGDCWTRSEGAAFARELRRHGSSPAEFKRAHPELAAIFAKPWPPRKPYWKRCSTGYACVRAVLPHYFESWRYPLEIVRCETGGTFSQHVVGDAGEVSIWQIHPVHFGWVDERRAVADIRYATSVAYRISEGGDDWSPWTCA